MNKAKTINFGDVCFLFVIIAMVFSIYVGFISYLTCIVLLLSRLIMSNKETAGLFLILFGGLSGGLIRESLPGLPIYGVIIMLFGFILLNKELIPFIRRSKKTLLFLFIFYFLIFIYYLYGPKTEYCNNKLFLIYLNGIVFLFSFYVLITSNKINNIILSQCILITVISYYVFSVQNFYFFNPNSLFDYEWFRLGFYQLSKEDSVLINYQQVGLSVLYAFAFNTTTDYKNNYIRKVYNLLLIIVGVQLVLSSGARQAIFGFLIILILYYIFTSKSDSVLRRMYLFLIILVMVYVIISVFQLLNISFISDVFDKTGDLDSRTGRGIHLLTTSRIISEHLFFGVGLGGYSLYNAGDYPHNFILEIICEFGIVGLLLIVLLVVVYLYSSNIRFKLLSINRAYFILIIFIIFIRSFISSDLKESIALFCAIFALYYNKYNVNQIK